MNRPERIFDYLQKLTGVRSQAKVKSMLMTQFKLTDKEAQEFIWAYALQD